LISLSAELNELLRRGGTVLVPSRQRAHAARLAYAAAELRRGARVWATPDILPVDAWLAREVERYAAKAGTGVSRLLSATEEWFLWRQCAAEATRDLELVNRGALAEALRRARSIAADFGIDFRKAGRSGPAIAAAGLSELAAEPGIEAALLAEVDRVIEERCRSLGVAPVASLVPQLFDSIDHEPAILGAGFLTLPPRLRARVIPAREVAPQGVPEVVIASDELDELERIALWCSRQIERQPDVRLLITLPGAPGTRERLATLVRQAINPRPWLEGTLPDSSMDSVVAIEGGGPLAGMPAIAHALATLSWLGGNAGDFEIVSSWLRAPYWRSPAMAARARLDLWLRERERMHFRVRDFVTTLNLVPSGLTATAREIAAQITRAAVALGQGAASPREWSERFRATLQVFDWPGERARTSGEQQTIVRFHELLDEFGQLAAVTGSILRDNAIQWFIELATRTAFRPADDDAVVTISSAFAPPVVRYDGLWVGGLHADVFPQPVQPDPFLSLASQLAAGVPAASASGRLVEARALLASWRACAGELVLSAPARMEDLELLPSPLLAEWLPRERASSMVSQGTVPQSPSMADSQPPTPADALWLPLRVQRQGMLESFEDAAGMYWPKERPLPSGTRSLELQNQCPFKAYAELRLGSRPLDAPEPGVAADQRGQLLHAALQKLWQRLRDSRGLSALSGSALEAAIHRCVEEAANDILRGSSSNRTRPSTSTDAQGDLFGNPQYSPSLSRECRRAERLIRALCVVERERAPFSVESTELDATLALVGAQLRVRIDRVDALESGGRAILDYKSGRRTAADWYGERPSHPQLLAYLAALGDDVIAMATVNITGREVRFDGIASTPELLPKVKGVEVPFGMDPRDAWPARRKEWLSRLEQLAAAFLAGRAALDPKPGACDYCHVSSICRIADRGLLSENDGPT
jgi:ATP-dependent helicase/nuclease subunit B